MGPGGPVLPGAIHRFVEERFHRSIVVIGDAPDSMVVDGVAILGSFRRGLEWSIDLNLPKKSRRAEICERMIMSSPNHPPKTYELVIRFETTDKISISNLPINNLKAQVAAWLIGHGVDGFVEGAIEVDINHDYEEERDFYEELGGNFRSD